MTTERKLACPKCGAENLNWHSRYQTYGERLHGDERAMPAFQARGGGFWVALIIDVVETGILAIYTFAVGMFLYQYRYLWILVVGPALGLVLCWVWPRVAGIELMVASLFPLSIIFLNVNMLSYNRAADGAAVIGLVTAPLLASGILFYRDGQHRRNDAAG